ncbi:trimethylguanosine synthase [Ceratitis capitata]|uniref:trimethylguanosine synthase n=1 Tax=Ceratitis capitata TaxID=7213 RepID=UPI0003299C4D|nr:trimethylguanosine synthase [Ceratitis capitata]XP_004536716.1 trimethylguanosine synthase [Ceratitis capitata]
MTDYFVESVGSVPTLYVFRNIFEAKEISEQIQLFAGIYEEELNKSFIEFWSLNSDKILAERLWINETNREPIWFAESDVESYQNFCEQIYVEQYQIYIKIYYEYYKHLHKSLTEKFDDQPISCEEEIDASFVDDFEKLQLLGLPTAFGRGTVVKQTKSKRSYPKVYSGYFSDEDNDCATVMDPVKINDLKDDDVKNSGTSSVHDIEVKVIGKKKKNRKLKGVPDFVLENKEILKYWRKRFSLFSRYDDGIRLDCESWFSVTPEKIATHLADRLSCDLIIDAFCGCGGNAIQFARTCNRVIAIDIDPIKISMAKHNAKIYGVDHKIDFIIGDFLQLSRCGRFHSDIIFLSPPWGGPKYKRKDHYDIENYLQPCNASSLMETAKSISENVVFYLPRNTTISQVIKLADKGNRCEVEHNYLDSRLVAITALYGESILKEKDI